MGMIAGDLAASLGGRLEGDAGQEIRGAASLEGADGFDLAFLDGERRLAAAQASRAGVLLVPEDVTLAGRTAIHVAHPRLAFARALELLFPEPARASGHHPLAVIDPAAEVSPEAWIGPLAVLAARSRVGPRAWIGAGSVLGEDVSVGADTRLVARVVVYPGTSIGERVLVHAGAVLGCDGFGFVRSPQGRLVKLRQVGRLVIEDDVEIGANTTIDRGALGLTRIGAGCKIDNLVQIAHNVTLGPDAAISAQVGIAGSASIGPGATLGGQVGIGDHARIGERATLGGQAGVSSHKVIRAGQILWGTPARPLAEIKRQLAQISRLAGLRERLDEVLERLGRLERPGGPPSPPHAEGPETDGDGGRGGQRLR